MLLMLAFAAVPSPANAGGTPGFGFWKEKPTLIPELTPAAKLKMEKFGRFLSEEWRSLWAPPAIAKQSADEPKRVVQEPSTGKECMLTFIGRFYDGAKRQCAQRYVTDAVQEICRQRDLTNSTCDIFKDEAKKGVGQMLPEPPGLKCRQWNKPFKDVLEKVAKEVADENCTHVFADAKDSD